MQELAHRENIMTVASEPDLRLDFPVTKKTIYMNNGAVAPTPLSVIKATTDFLVKCADEGPDSQATSDYITALLKELRTRVAHLINCEPEEVVLTQSTTDGINAVASGIGWKKGDAVIVRGGRHEHPANYLPWLRLKEKGISLSELVVDRDGFFDLGELEKLAKKGRLLALSHALYNTGAIMPLEEAGKIANENNLLYCIDAAQTVGSIKVDVKRIGCQFLAFPGFKWLCGPMGIGVFYCSRKAAEMLSPCAIGGESATSSGDTIVYMDMPRRLQAGFRNYPGAAGLEAALRYILRVGIDSVRARNIKVANALRQELGRINGIELHGPADESRRTSIVTFTVPNDPAYVVRKLEESGIVLAERDAGFAKVIRAAPHFFNTEEEAATVAARIKGLL